MLIKIGDIFRDLTMKVVFIYASLPTIWRVILIPIWIVCCVLAFIFGWLLMIPYVIKYGKNAWGMQQQHQAEYAQKIFNKIEA